MDITQLYIDLSHGKLSNLAMANDGNGTITDAGKPKVLLAANEALLRLHSRFVLKENDLLLEMVEHITNYHLLSKFAESSFMTSTQPYLYIKDLMREPFQEDVIRILTVQDQQGTFLPINDDGQVESVFTPQGTVLQVPRPRGGEPLSVVYQAKHAALLLEAPDTPIELPDCLHDAFRSYIAWNIYDSMNTQEATIKAQQHLAMYESLCQEAIDRDLVSNSLSTTSNRFSKRGWI